MMFAFQTFAFSDVNKQREQISRICILFCAVAVLSFFFQFLQVCVTILAYNVSLKSRQAEPVHGLNVSGICLC